MNKKIIIIICFICLCLLLAGPVCAKEKVKVKITTEEGYGNHGFIVIKLLDSKGKSIKSKGTIHYQITDSDGNYKWAYKPYKGELRLSYDAGTYDVNVKFDGDSKYRGTEKTKTVTVLGGQAFDAYTYYDNNNWGLNQKIDDYIEYNYWDEEIYDDPATYDGEGP